MISIIVAYNKNRVIGKDGKIPWKLPEDLKRFKELTMGCPIIMGRKTHESIGRFLPGRHNIILSKKWPYHSPYLADEQWCASPSLSLAIEYAKRFNKEIFFIGGSEVYRQAMPLCDKMYLTEVDNELEGDAIFPELQGQWNTTEEIAKSGYTFLTLERKQ